MSGHKLAFSRNHTVHSCVRQGTSSGGHTVHRNHTLSSLRSIPVFVVLIASLVACAKSDRERASVDKVPPPIVLDSDRGIAERSSADEGQSTDEQARIDERAATDERAHAADDASIVVNGEALPAETVRQLQQIYPVTIAPGRYWYDAVSGAYGREGEPIGGQMIPALPLGGRLKADASRGTSGVFINGRQITVGEKVYLERLCQTPVVPARYWVLSNGLGGLEGGPANFNLAQCPGVPQQNSGPRSMSRTFCDANGACTTSGILGSILTTPR